MLQMRAYYVTQDNTPRSPLHTTARTGPVRTYLQRYQDITNTVFLASNPLKLGLDLPLTIEVELMFPIHN